MNYEDDEDIYVEFTITGVLKAKSTLKKAKLKKIQALISKIIEDPNLDLIKFDSTVNSFTQLELMNSLINYSDEEN
jgi:hypothetical protein